MGTESNSVNVWQWRVPSFLYVSGVNFAKLRMYIKNETKQPSPYLLKYRKCSSLKYNCIKSFLW